jgi:hypothetical protein
MDFYNSCDRKYGYNLRRDTKTSCILSDETKKRMSISAYKRYAEPTYDKMKHSHSYWKNNPEAVKMMGKKVSLATRRYRFEQYTRDMIYIKTWDSVEDIIRNNPDWKWQNIYSVCNGYKKNISKLCVVQKLRYSPTLLEIKDYSKRKLLPSFSW